MQGRVLCMRLSSSAKGIPFIRGFFMRHISSAAGVSFKNILFLADFSPASSQALAYSLALARHFHARLFPAHVLEDAFTGCAGAGDAATIDVLEEKKRRQLLRLVEYNGIGFKPLVSRCDFESAVPHWITEYGIDLIVVGTQGRGRLQRSLLGSTAELALQNAFCPVLTVGPNVNVPRQFSLAFDNILFPTDLRPNSEAVLAYALGLASERNARLTLLHVLPEDSWQYRDRRGILRFTIDELQKLLPEATNTLCRPEMAVDSGEAGEQILRFARNEHTDLIVMGMHCVAEPSCEMRTGVSYRVISSAACPVLTTRNAAGIGF